MNDRSQDLFFAYVDWLMATNEGTYPPGSLLHNALSRLKDLMQKQLDFVAKSRTVTLENAATLFEENVALNKEAVEQLTNCAALLSEAGVEYDRNLLMKLQGFQPPKP